MTIVLVIAVSVLFPLAIVGAGYAIAWRQAADEYHQLLLRSIANHEETLAMLQVHADRWGAMAKAYRGVDQAMQHGDLDLAMEHMHRAVQLAKDVTEVN